MNGSGGGKSSNGLKNGSNWRRNPASDGVFVFMVAIDESLVGTGGTSGNGGGGGG